MTNGCEAHEGDIIDIFIAARLKQPDISTVAEIANDLNLQPHAYALS